MCKCDDLDSSTYLLIAVANLVGVRGAMVRLKFVAMMINRATSFQVVAFVALLMASLVVREGKKKRYLRRYLWSWP